MLREREINFTYDYRMRCEHCMVSNLMTAENYHSLSGSGMTACSGCREDFNFGPKVIDLRDLEDEALDATKVPELAWYHTTTDPEWPRASWTLPDKELRHLRETACWPEEQIERHRRFYENQALHVGTYEAAIESMLRRMEEQDDRESVFYLHRVRLRQDIRVAPDWRDENHEQAAKITWMDLAAQNWDVIRYLNAHEAMGSISLALVRDATASTQQIRLPVPRLVDPHSEATLARMRSYRKGVGEIREAAAGRALSPLEKLRQRAAARQGELRTPEPIEVHGVLSKMGHYVADQYLAGVSPVVRHDFLHAIGGPNAENNDEADLAWLTKVANLAALLTHADKVLNALDNQPWQDIRPA
ncbi:hypothetical protein B1A87_003095 [Arthrobacter sp. KBS0703]|uniref:hypothetical protein n=1 Tax=Arthrobacter sp. KBS0703 TaxID=1955698 RepID=UPI0009D0BB5F|nr:hypothetical protein [Arthrobacter sp. KBS0703]TSE15051.1 hypothetical protein B1A87_003095 [Arthrobacter sp. KBS0703]